MFKFILFVYSSILLLNGITAEIFWRNIDVVLDVHTVNMLKQECSSSSCLYTILFI